jgi:cell division septation protein DedD
MRDADRLKEKTEIALDDRQIAGLAIGALLLLGGVFAVGLLVGKHLAARTQPVVAAAELAVAEPRPVPAKAPVVPPPPPPVVEPPAPAPKQDLGEFTVQLGASKDRAEAQRLEQRARAAGLKPYMIEADLGPQKGTWYRVRVGAFKDKDAAGRFRSDVERELRSTAVVMSTH